MLSGPFESPDNLPGNALANLAFLYGGDRCHCNNCDRCSRRKAFANPNLDRSIDSRLVSHGP